MNARLLTAAACLFALAGPLSAADPKADEKDVAKQKEALQELGEFIGQWKVNGEGTVDGKKAIWKETWDCSWKFAKEGGEPSIAVGVTDAKFFTKADIKYDLKKKVYVVTATDAKAEDPTVFTGKLAKGKLQLDRKDEKSGDVYKLTLNTAAEGVRMVALYEVQTGGKGLAAQVYKAAGNKEGESFAGGGGKNKKECVVTGGTGTIAVSYNGKQYYVCCSGCKEEFDANPKKYADAFDKKK